jgi:endo-1,4-beta-xylanase
MFMIKIASLLLIPTEIMVSFKDILLVSLGIIPRVITVPSAGVPESNSLTTRQNAPWQWWTEGSGQFNCQQQGGGTYSCSWNGQSGGGMVAGTGWYAGPK